jgi:kumamolisin
MILPKCMKIWGINILAFSLVSTMMAQEPPVRPPSDSTKAHPDQSGTNYLRHETQQVNTKDIEKLLQETKPATREIHKVAPTSDKINKSESSRSKALLEKINPALVHFGDLEAYTNYLVVRPNTEAQHYSVTSPNGTRPATIRSLYNMKDRRGSGVIAIVDAFHYPTAASDLDKFSKTLGLPSLPDCPQQNPFGGGPCLRIEANPTAPIDCGWNGEAALDLQWAHAIAPEASLLYVEAMSSRNSDLYAAVAKARDEIAALHGQLSMSWGTPGESAQALGFASTFTDGVLYFAATGDTGGQIGFPAAFPNVVAVGGTTLTFASDGSVGAENGWPDSGGGVSSLEKPAPRYQVGVKNVQQTGRNIPDVSAVSDANPAVPVLVSTPTSQCQDHPSPEQYMAGWTQLVGTSLATPVFAAMVNVAGHHNTGVLTELQAIYGNRNDRLRIKDIIFMDGTAGGNATKVGYDNVTGVGVPASMDFDAKHP